MRPFMTTLAKTACAVMTSATIAAADNTATVVELYTSQGCLSCPPADAMLSQLAQDPGIIALSLHVDYWDYLGWKDDLADPAYSARQKDYAERMQARTVYTPQIVVNGRRDIVGSKPMRVMGAINAERASENPVTVELARDASGLTVRAAAGRAGQGVVQLVRYLPEVSKNIARGENAGRSMRYANVVIDWSVVSAWDMSTPLAIKVPLTGDAAVAVIVQDGPGGAILGAAALR